MKNPTLLGHDHSDLDRLLSDAFSALDGGAVERSFITVDVFWARLAMHIRAEHLHLFPTLLRTIEAAAQKKELSDRPSLEAAQSKIAQLQEDHDYFMRELATAVKELRSLRDQPDQYQTSILRMVLERISAVSRRLELHNELEESQVYRWAGVLLEAPEQARLNQEIECELENLPPRFEAK
jgi:hypothetical protein